MNNRNVSVLLDRSLTEANKRDAAIRKVRVLRLVDASLLRRAVPIVAVALNHTANRWHKKVNDVVLKLLLRTERHTMPHKRFGYGHLNCAGSWVREFGEGGSASFGARAESSNKRRLHIPQRATYFASHRDLRLEKWVVLSGYCLPGIVCAALRAVNAHCRDRRPERKRLPALGASLTGTPGIAIVHSIKSALRRAVFVRVVRPLWREGCSANEASFHVGIIPKTPVTFGHFRAVTTYDW